MDVKVHTSFATNQRVYYFHLYDPNSSDPTLPYLFHDVEPLTKRHGLTTPLTGSFTVSVTFSFTLSFPLAGKGKVIMVFHFFLKFFMFRTTHIITFYELCLELFDGTRIFIPLVS